MGSNTIQLVHLEMEHKFLNIFLLTILFVTNSVYTRPAIDDFMNIAGMQKRADGKLYFNGERVKSVSTIGGDKVFEQSKEVEEYGSDYGNALSEDSMEDSREALREKLNSLGDITKIEKIKKMLPIKSIQNVIGVKEIKNIEEIHPEVAEKFIKEENLENIVDEFTLEENEAIDREIDNLQKEIDVLERVKEKHNKKQESSTESSSEETVEDSDEDPEDYESSENGIGKVVDVKPIKTIEEVKSTQAVKSIKPVVNLYALTEEQAAQLKRLINE